MDNTTGIAPLTADEVKLLEEEMRSKQGEAIRLALRIGISRNRLYSAIGAKGTTPPGELVIMKCRAYLESKKTA